MKTKFNVMNVDTKFEWAPQSYTEDGTSLSVSSYFFLLTEAGKNSVSFCSKVNCNDFLDHIRLNFP